MDDPIICYIYSNWNSQNISAIGFTIFGKTWKNTRGGVIDSFFPVENKVKENKGTIPWISKIFKRYKRDTILGNWRRPQKITSDLDSDIKVITTKCSKVAYPPRLI